MKIKALVLATVMGGAMCLPLAACGKDGPNIDKTKTQLYVSNHDAGIGRTWITAIGSDFEKAFENYSFQEGRKGVQIIYNHNRTTNGVLLESSIAKSKDNVFFTEGIDYPSVQAKNLVYDVTEIMEAGAITGVDENNNFIREETPIKDKIDKDFLVFLDRNSATDEENYYAFPFYLAVKGPIMDRDLWNENKYYLAKGGAPSEIVVKAMEEGGDVTAAKAQYEAAIATLKGGDRSNNWILVDENGVYKYDGGEVTLGLCAGPDGKYGTYDDGMPATYDEFYLLMDELVGDKISPFIYTGKYPGYADNLANNLFWDYEGAEALRVYYSLHGTVNDLAKIDENGKIVRNPDGTPVLESHTFNGGKTDGYEVQRMIGKYEALKFVEKVAKSSGWVCKESDNTAVSHISAQSKFLTSCLPDSNIDRVAMLFDGAWWQQESDQTFTIMAKKNKKYSKENRNLGFLTLPNANIDKLEYRKANDVKKVIVSQNDSFCVVNNNLKEGSPQLAVAKAFVSFIHNDEMLLRFMEKTNMSRALTIQTEKDYSKLSVYGQNLVKFVNDAQYVYHYTDNELFLKNYTYLANTGNGWNWHTLTYKGQLEVYYPMSSFRVEQNIKDGLTAESFFTGLYNYYKNRVWDRLI